MFAGLILFYIFANETKKEKNKRTHFVGFQYKMTQNNPKQ